jgi:hypothetical protein
MLILPTQQFLLILIVILLLSTMLYSLEAMGVVLVHCILAKLENVLAILQRLVVKVLVVHLLILLLMC